MYFYTSEKRFWQHKKYLEKIKSSQCCFASQSLQQWLFSLLSDLESSMEFWKWRFWAIFAILLYRSSKVHVSVAIIIFSGPNQDGEYVFFKVNFTSNMCHNCIQKQFQGVAVLYLGLMVLLTGRKNIHFYVLSFWNFVSKRGLPTIFIKIRPYKWWHGQMNG